MDSPDALQVCTACGHRFPSGLTACPECGAVATTVADDAAVAEAKHRAKVRDRTELAIAVLLGVAAILTAWAAFQSAQLGGSVTTNYSEGIRLSDTASQAYNEATAADIADEALFLEFAKATSVDDTATASYIHDSLMSDELTAAVDWWAEQPDSAGYDTPFTPDNPKWSTEAFDNAAALDAESQVKFEQAKKDDKVGGSFDVLSIIIAIALFLFGVASLVRQERIKVGLGIVGGVILVFSIIRLIGLGNPAGVSLGLFF